LDQRTIAYSMFINQKLEENIYGQIASHNLAVNTTVYEIKDNEFIDNQCIEELIDSKIHPLSEMQGAGLRNTFVNLAKDRLYLEKIRVWKKRNEQLNIQKKSARIAKTSIYTSAFAIPLYFILAFAILSVGKISFEKFGDKLVSVSKGKDFDKLEIFINQTFGLIQQGKLKDLNWSSTMSPEYRFMAIDRLFHFENFEDAQIIKIFKNSSKKNAFYVSCRIIKDSNCVNFRFLCEQEKEQYVIAGF